MAIRLKLRPRETASVCPDSLARRLARDLKGAITGIVSPSFRGLPVFARGTDPVIDAVLPAMLKAEIDALPANQRLVERGSFHVYWTRATQAPCVLQEIGRLREFTFRAVGEGSGKRADIDAFDAYYLHLFVWDARARMIVGAYRLGLVDEILARYGKRGLYTHSLFRYRAKMLEALNPAIELGRSFVRAEYQRNFAPMMLLWCGIGRFIERFPQYAVLFGPVSISNSYTSASRRLIVEYLFAHAAETDLMDGVRPRRPLRDYSRRRDGEVSRPCTFDEMSRMVEQIEPDHKGVPVLIRQYLRFGARVVAFNVDRRFGNVLDGLMMADLRRIERAVLERYMGTSGTMAFRAYHALDSPPTRVDNQLASGIDRVAVPSAGITAPWTGCYARSSPQEHDR